MAPMTQEVTPANAGSTRRSDAVGMEIPVVVHASRYSAASRGTAKALPSVHEETRTVIVFPQGAVVRLSAAMIQGELVVLTNQQTGADVLCKVANVKAQPGIQNYVDLEFTQRAPGFWGDCFSSGAPRAEKSAEPEAPAAAGQPPAKEAAPVPVPAPTQQVEVPERSAAMQPKPVPPPVVSEPQPSAVAAKRDDATGSSTAVPAPPNPPVPSVPATAPVAPVVESAGLSSASTQIAAVPAAVTRDFGRGLSGSLLAETASSSAPRSVDSAEVSSPSSSKKMLFIGVAAVVVLALTGGGFLLYRQGRSSAQASVPEAAQQVSSSSAATSSGDGSMVTVSAEPVVVSAVTENPSAAPQNPNAPKSASAPADDSRRPGIPVEKLSRPKFKGAAEVNSMEPPVLSAEANQPVLGTGLVAGRDGAAAPGSVPAAPGAEGGRIDPPKLASSPSAIYPAMARNSNIEGVVVVDALVDASGTVTQAQAVSGPTLLRQAAADSVRSWKYQPAKLNGQPIAVHTQVSVDFHLNAASVVTGSGAPANSIAATSSLPPSAAPVAAPAAPATGVIQAPKLIASPPPVYPNNARSSSVEGVVVLDLLVDETGKVTQAKVVSGPVLLQPAAVEAVHSWKYQPARQNGQPVAQHTQVSINFRLR